MVQNALDDVASNIWQAFSGGGGMLEAAGLSAAWFTAFVAILVERCRLTLSKSVLNTPKVSALEITMC